jgi:hypothetical protein
MPQAQITVALEKSLISCLDALAEADGRTRTGMLRVILSEGVRHRRSFLEQQRISFGGGVRHRAPARRKARSA